MVYEACQTYHLSVVTEKIRLLFSRITCRELWQWCFLG